MNREESFDAAMKGIAERLRAAHEATAKRITADINALIENALEPVKGRGLLPICIDGSDATPLQRVRAVATRLAEWDTAITELSAIIVHSPKLRAEFRAGESSLDFAIRKLREMS